MLYYISYVPAKARLASGIAFIHNSNTPECLPLYYFYTAKGTYL